MLNHRLSEGCRRGDADPGTMHQRNERVWSGSKLQKFTVPSSESPVAKAIAEAHSQRESYPFQYQSGAVSDGGGRRGTPAKAAKKTPPSRAQGKGRHQKGGKTISRGVDVKNAERTSAAKSYCKYRLPSCPVKTEQALGPERDGPDGERRGQGVGLTQGLFHIIHRDPPKKAQMGIPVEADRSFNQEGWTTKGQEIE